MDSMAAGKAYEANGLTYIGLKERAFEYDGFSLGILISASVVPHGG